MVMLSELMTAEEAYRIGIVACVVPDAELQAKAGAMAEQLSKGPTRAHEATKLVIGTWSTSGVRAADEVMIGAVVDLLDTRDCRAGIDAAIEAHAAGRPRPDTAFTGE
jgi:enoyl-CoA hydratase